MELINISNLSFKYQKTNVLENINLSIKSDDFLAIIGPNGGG
ncbi:ABC transporter, partial [Aliarcobacter butzleri]